MVLMGGVGPAYYLSGFRYNEVATARSITQPLLLLQGDRDYQVTVAHDLDVWLKRPEGAQGRHCRAVPQGRPSLPRRQRPADAGGVRTARPHRPEGDRHHRFLGRQHQECRGSLGERPAARNGHQDFPIGANRPLVRRTRSDGTSSSSKPRRPPLTKIVPHLAALYIDQGGQVALLADRADTAHHIAGRPLRRRRLRHLGRLGAHGGGQGLQAQLPADGDHRPPRASRRPRPRGF
jgi:hypothetical protein